jgi:hypothetical protein
MAQRGSSKNETDAARRSVLFTFATTPEERQRLRRNAEQRGISAAALIRSALASYGVILST